MGKKFWSLLRLYTGIALAAVLLLTVWRSFKGHTPPAEGLHFVLILPERGSIQEPVQDAVASLESTYGLRLELHTFPSVSEQKRLLRLLPQAGVDGVLLWPISANDEDYTTEAQALSTAGVPFVVVDRDIQQSFRDSFIGSGYKSDLLMLSQSIRSLKYGERFVVGSRFSSDGGQTVELLFFQRGESGGTFSSPQDTKLQQFAEHPPNGYQAVDCQRVEAANVLQLKEILMELFSAPQPPELFFSLEQTLSSVAATAKRDLPDSCGVHLLCYGEQSENQSNLENGVVDGLVTTLPEVSITIGVRYLRDICRGYWVPDAIDSGATLLIARTGTEWFTGGLT